MGNVIMKAQQITYGASNVEKALDDLKAPELIELNKRMDAIDAWKANVHEETYTGSELAIENALALPARSLITSINAIQDLHGYDNPWVGGADKNKLPMTVSAIKAANTSGTWSGNVYTIANMTFEILVDNADNVIGIKANGTPNVANAEFNLNSALDLPNENVIINGCPADGSTTTYRIRLGGDGGGYIGADTGNGATLSGASVKSAAIYISSAVSNLIFKPMIRLASVSDASFAPYSNICPISGRDSVVITRSDGDEISEDFTIQLGQTVYGADINWDTGVMTVTHQRISARTLTWALTAYNTMYTSDLSGLAVKPERATVLCNIVPYKNITNGNGEDNVIFWGGTITESNGNLCVKCTSIATNVGAWTAYINNNDVYICYKLAAPIELTLTPTEVQMLKGYNRVTIESGSIELKALVLGGDY